MDLWDFNDILSDDDEIMEYLPRSHVRLICPRTNLSDTLQNDKFLRRFRLTKETTQIVLQQIEHHLKCKTDRNEAATPMNQLLCTLRYYATGSQLITCGDIIGVQEATACRIIHRVTHAIALLYSNYIKFPDTAQEQQNLAAKFHKIAKFPRVNGAIDCTHVRIISPGGNKKNNLSYFDIYIYTYRNRKGYFSINTQCVAASDLSFLDVVARWHGSAHDSNIWDNCALKRNFIQGKYGDKLLLGDSGYAQTKFMMTPLADNNVRTRGEALYQQSQIKTRNVVERAFGVWKRRFPIMSRGINVQLRRVPGIIVATAVLHNIAIWQKDDIPEEDIEFPILTDLPDVQSQAGRKGRNWERTLLIEEYFARL